MAINGSSSGRGHIILGDNLGLVHLLDRHFKRESFKAYNINTSHVLQLKQSGFLGTVGVSLNLLPILGKPYLVFNIHLNLDCRKMNLESILLLKSGTLIKGMFMEVQFVFT